MTDEFFGRATALILAVVVATVSGCGSDGDFEPGAAPDEVSATAPQARFMTALAAHCGEVFPGRLAREPQGDTMLTGTELLLVHFRGCDADELRMPFHVEREATGDWDSSRTWYVMRFDDGLELRHDHRNADGSEDSRTWYGGVTATSGTAAQQDFPSPERTAAAGVPVGWRIEVEPGVRYRYGTTYDGAYDWMIEFDLSEPFAGVVPEAWGLEQPPSRIPGAP